MKLKTFIIILAIALLLMGIRWTDNIGTGYLKNWFKFMRTSSYIHQRRGVYIMSDSTDTNFGWATNDTLGRAVKCRFLRNTSGGTVKKDDVVVWDNTELEIVAQYQVTGAVDTATIALSGETEKNPLDLIVKIDSDPADADTIEITGLQYNGSSAKVESIIKDADGEYFSTVEWDTISMIRVLGATVANDDSITVTAYQQSVFTTTTSDDDINHCGVVYSDTIADNYWGLIAYEGRIDSVKCDASSIDAIIGRPVTTSNTVKHCEPRTSATAGAVLGRCLESDNTDGRISIWLGGD